MVVILQMRKWRLGEVKWLLPDILLTHGCPVLPVSFPHLLCPTASFCLLSLMRLRPSLVCWGTF